MIDAISKTGQLPGLQMRAALAPGTNNVIAAATGGFESVLKSVATQTVDALYKGEMTAIAGLNGKASVQQVVTQVMAAERALQTTITIRDKAVSAYQEISRMAI